MPYTIRLNRESIAPEFRPLYDKAAKGEKHPDNNEKEIDCYDEILTFRTLLQEYDKKQQKTLTYEKYMDWKEKYKDLDCKAALDIQSTGDMINYKLGGSRVAYTDDELAAENKKLEELKAEKEEHPIKTAINDWKLRRLKSMGSPLGWVRNSKEKIKDQEAKIAEMLEANKQADYDFKIKTERRQKKYFGKW